MTTTKSARCVLWNRISRYGARRPRDRARRCLRQASCGRRIAARVAQPDAPFFCASDKLRIAVIHHRIMEIYHCTLCCKHLHSIMDNKLSCCVA